MFYLFNILFNYYDGSFIFKILYTRPGGWVGVCVKIKALKNIFSSKKRVGDSILKVRKIFFQFQNIVNFCKFTDIKLGYTRIFRKNFFNFFLVNGLAFLPSHLRTTRYCNFKNRYENWDHGFTYFYYQVN